MHIAKELSKGGIEETSDESDEDTAFKLIDFTVVD